MIDAPITMQNTFCFVQPSSF